MTQFEIALRSAITAEISRQEADLRVLTREARERLSDTARAYFDKRDEEIISVIEQLRQHLGDMLHASNEHRTLKDGR